MPPYLGSKRETALPQSPETTSVRGAASSVPSGYDLPPGALGGAHGVRRWSSACGQHVIVA